MLVTTKDARWSEFTKLLFANLGHSVPGSCDHTLAISRELLVEMGLKSDDVEATLGYFKVNGGFCDCEVLFNVERVALPVDEQPRFI